jgi:hypothetical protein
LQSIYNQKLFTKDIKNAKQQGLGLEDKNLQIKEGGALRSENMLRIANKIRECLGRVNICNQ